jgi:DNA-binding IclR family transcriptional regulator
MLASDLAGEGDVIQVVSRAFDVLRCFEGHEARLGNLEISNRCGLPRSTVSRLTHTLTRMGQLVYLPHDQKYRIGPSAVAMSTSMMSGLQLRNLIRLRLQDVAEQFPGTVGFVIPDRFDLVYLEFARAANALGLHSSTGSRIAMASTAAGHAYTAALDVEVGDALLAEMEREIPEDAKLLRPRIEDNRRFLRGTAMSHRADCGVRISTVSLCRCGRRSIRLSLSSPSVFWPRCSTRKECTRRSRRGSRN